MEAREIKEKRNRREKYFLKENGNISVRMYGRDVHYKKNGKYEEIDNSLIKTKDYFVNKSNDYKVYFKTNKEGLMKVEKDDSYLDISLKGSNVKKIKKGKEKSKIVYNNILDEIDFEYLVLSNEIKETIILKKKEKIKKKLTFEINTNLTLKLTGNIIEGIKEDRVIFKIKAPYMIDAKMEKSYNLLYELKGENGTYELDLILDSKWLMEEERKFPVIIDPTLVIGGTYSGVTDTYIYQGDTNAEKESEVLKVGVEKTNGTDRINRSLIKFDLPDIGTASQIIEAKLVLSSYFASDDERNERKLVEVHRVTTEWNKDTADWNSMHDKYDPRIEMTDAFVRTNLTVDNPYVSQNLIGGEITNLVKKWYTGTNNYGIMIRAVDEVYEDDNFPEFFSSRHPFGSEAIGDVAPYLEITYRNQNGIENYWDYKSQAFTIGTGYVNTNNGNWTGTFEVGKTIKGKMPVTLSVIYNTNDVVLENNTYYGRGFRLNLDQSIEKLTGNDNVLLYHDADGTIHYFFKRENVFYDEDGLNLKIEKINDSYIMSDKTGGKMTFTIKNEKGYLSKIEDVNDNRISIERDSSNKIVKVKDGNDKEILINYEENKIIVVSPSESVELNYVNNKLASIITKEGTTELNYSSNNLITSIKDVTGIKVVYDYYENKPYRLKKVTQYGIDNTEGEYYTLNYGMNSTEVVDNKGRKNIIIYNTSGNKVSQNSLTNVDDIDSAYSKVTRYGEEESKVNKIISSTIPVSYIKNYLKDTSFEKETNNFVSSSGTTTSIVDTTSNSGQFSLKAETEEDNQYIKETITVPKGKYYTFSGYLKSSADVYLTLAYTDANGEEKETTEKVKQSTKFIREGISIYYDEDAVSNLTIQITIPNKNTILYLDDIQLEEGEVINHYNLLDNSDFEDGLSDWTLSAHKAFGSEGLPLQDKITVTNINTKGKKALKVKMNPKERTNFKKSFNISGKKGDTYYISFWYKNEGIKPIDYFSQNAVIIFYNPTEPQYAERCFETKELLPGENIWKYFSYSFTAEYDYNEIRLEFNQAACANELYITNLTMYKDVKENDYSYDENGNLNSIKEKERGNTSFKYDNNNQLINATSPRGSNLKAEYDNIHTDRVINSISSLGINNKTKYDSFGNPILTRISKKTEEELTDGLYKIRGKGTDKYLKALEKEVLLEDDTCSNTLWQIEKVEDKYKIKLGIINEYSLKYSNNNITLSKDNSDNLFTLEKNDNGSYHILVEATFEDIENEGISKNKYIKIVGEQLTLEEEDSNFIVNDPTYEFYFETKEEEFIENSATYSEDGRFVTSTTDTLLNKTEYMTDQVSGFLKTITDAKGNTTTYTYDDKQQLININLKNKNINYSYNAQNLLSKITEGERKYNLFYDNFLNTNKVMIGDNITLSSNTYEANNGNLIKTVYGNNQEITFDYDLFDRVKTVHTMNEDYNYRYDGNGNLSKIYSNNHLTKFTRDKAKRISSYKSDNFRVDYDYDNNDNVTGKSYQLEDIENTIENTYNKDDMLIKTELDDKTIDYLYDELGRIKNKKIDNNYTTEYEYVRNGKRTSTLIKNIKNNNDKYTYKYDELNNITEIYYNDELINKYEYDEYNELIKDEDYLKNEINEYNYDNYGNILTKVTKNKETDVIIKTDTYQYGNEDWLDQLTSYNNRNITYDVIGNPLTIGTDITMEWINGRQLKKYMDSSKNLNITYQYNQDGIRTSKTIGNSKTKYYLEGLNIIYEQRGENLIYYLYDGTGIIGLKYNGNHYYYIKNIQGDVVGILDSSYNKIVSYEYDSFGKILSIKDNNGNEITDITNIGIINPFRYRSYYYDEETGLYYLNSRYYNPIWGRFINADGRIGANKDVLGYNLYTYCSNNPIIYYDKTGFGKTYVFVYYGVAYTDEETNTTYMIEKNFDIQAKNSPYFVIDNENVIRINVSRNEEFVKKWNEMEDDDIDNIYMYLHGEPGILHFYGAPFDSFDSLENKQVNGKVVLFSCNGAASDKNGISVASELSKKTGAPVVANTGKVSYTKNIFNGKYYARTSFLHFGLWKTTITLVTKMIKYGLEK